MNRHTPAIPLALIIVGLVLAAMNMRSPIVMIGSIFPMLADSFAMTAAQIGYLGALPMPLFALGALVAPSLAKRFGIEPMMIVMTLLLSLGVAGRAWLDMTTLFIGTLLVALAIGMLNALTAPFIKKHAPNHIASATGIFSLSMSVLAGLAAWAVVPLSENFGWRMALSFWAVFGMMAAGIWLIVLQKHRSHTAKPITLQSDQQTTQTTTQTHTITMEHTSAEAVRTFNPWRSVAAWQMSVFLGLQSLMFYWAASFLTAVGMGYGMTLGAATQLMLAFQLAAPPAILLLTFLMKRGFSTQLFGLICAILNALGVAGLLWLPAYSVFWAAMMGFGGAATFTLMLMMFSVRTGSFETARDLSGMAQAVGYSLAFFGPMGLGLIFEQTQNWHTPLFVLFVLMAINIPFGFLASKSERVDAN
ncbi:MFS transporter [Moraxella caviae]|uniref:Inner membrane transport protein YeaN n=1 Tax=Moraxella caviae TaxID=34060 RepID=A0A1T0AD29_9GAMM|nr:MFS transporter [Moraxella caviae]OOR93211.1 MFS transporter [Moraxella caviae]STZ10485.1 Inner membrane transport protein YeaN [Moraxella caviae]